MPNIEFSFTLSGDQALLEKSAAYRRQIPRACLNAVRRVLRRRVTMIKRRIRQESGIGQTIWGARGKQGGLDKLVRVGKPIGTGDTLTVPVKLVGLPAMIERGGHTAPHVIEAKNAPRLAFTVSGRPVFAKRVNHPGSIIRPHGYAEAVLKDAEVDIVREVNDAIAKLRQRLFSQAA